jgi:hypothetical protein
MMGARMGAFGWVNRFATGLTLGLTLFAHQRGDYLALLDYLRCGRLCIIILFVRRDDNWFAASPELTTSRGAIWYC